VWLVGSGPGDPDLLTRRAERLLRTAGIIFYDALVSVDILALAPQARLVCVGKRSGHHSVAQSMTCRMLVEAAKAGLRVVRLKGGDPAMFGRAAEELSALRKAGIRVDICPGVTAASAAAAAVGVSLSLRGVARRVQFITAHSRRGFALDLDWAALAAPDATLVVYMGRDAAPELSRNLIDAGMPATTAVVIACNVSQPDQKLLRTRLDLLPLVTRGFAQDAPTLIMIGDAVARTEEEAILEATMLQGAAELP
jgi:uroporphyrin-III C-methyltransferase